MRSGEHRQLTGTNAVASMAVCGACTVRVRKARSCPAYARGFCKPERIRRNHRGLYMIAARGGKIRKARTCSRVGAKCVARRVLDAGNADGPAAGIYLKQYTEPRHGDSRITRENALRKLNLPSLQRSKRTIGRCKYETKASCDTTSGKARDACGNARYRCVPSRCFWCRIVRIRISARGSRRTLTRLTDCREAAAGLGLYVRNGTVADMVFMGYS